MHEKDEAATEQLPAETAETSLTPTPASAQSPAKRTPSPQLASEEIVVSAPLSFHGSAARIWRPLARNAETTDNPVAQAGWYSLAAVLVGLAWCVVLSWYLIFGLLVVPYRLIRRGQRKRKLEEARHRELLAAHQRETGE